MTDFVSKLFDGGDFPARWHCGMWTEAHGYLHIVSDLLVFGAYMAIPTVLAFFTARRRDVPFPGLFWLFVMFILVCGITHLNEAVIFYHPYYRFAGVMKLVTAMVSWMAVIALVKVMPAALALRSPEQLEEIVRARTAELSAARQRFAMVVEAPSGMLVVDEGGTITLANPFTARIFDYDLDELVGMRLDQLIPEGASELLQKVSRDSPPRPIGVGEEVVGRRKDGSDVPVEIGLNMVDAGETEAILASVVDITQRKRAEKEREQLITDLRLSNEELAEFANVASHDLQEPLRSVVSYTQLLADEYSDSLDGDASHYIDYIVRGGVRMKQLINDLLDYSRVETTSRKRERISAEDALALAVDNLEHALSASGGTVTHDQPLPDVVADPSQLTRLFQNLIGNGLKFGRDGAAPAVHVSAREEADRWVFAVRDNGIGIEQEYAERIFRPFQRLHRRSTYEGSGIGLAIAKKIVLRHHGSIWLESVIGEGTTFYFSLPKSESEARGENGA